MSVYQKLDKTQEAITYFDLYDNGVNKNNFVIIKLIINNNKSVIYLVRKKNGIDRNRLYAMKVISKMNIENHKNYEHSLNELNILKKNNNSIFLNKLYYAFNDEACLYLILEYAANGDLYEYHCKNSLNEDNIKIIIAELCLAVDQLHEQNIMHRDIKLENVLIDQNGHIILADFGLASFKKRTTTFCGTYEYMAPEVLAYTTYDNMVDIWAIGVIMFILLSDNYYEKHYTLTDIENNLCHVSDECRNLIMLLLDKNPVTRIGKDINVIKNHLFFKDIDWKKIKEKKYNTNLKLNKNIKIEKTIKFEDCEILKNKNNTHYYDFSNFFYINPEFLL